MKKIRVLFVHSGADLYGASRSLLRLASRLTKDGAEIKVVLPYDGPLKIALQEYGAEVIIQPDLAIIEREKVKSIIGLVNLLFKLVTSVFHLRRIIKEFRPELLHTVTAVILSSGLAAKLTGKPHILHVRESFSEFGFLWKIYQYYISAFSKVVVCVSTPIAKQFSPQIIDKSVIVIHNGFPLDEFNTVDSERVNKFKKEFSLDKADALVGVVGRIKFRRKGQEVFVEAASFLRGRFPNIRFLCIGSPFPGNESHLDMLTDLIRKLGLDNYVVYTGDVEDIKAAISALDILVLPSVQPEPFGGVVIEAMALACPVIATKIGGSIEQVVDGVTGLFVEPGNAVDLANSIEKLLNDPKLRREMGRGGRQRYMDMFEFEPFYRKMTAVYKMVLVSRHN